MSVFLVTGVAGFIGSFVAKRLLDQGHQVVGVDNLNDYYSVDLKKHRLEMLADHDNFDFFKLDIADDQQLELVFQSYNFSKVIHLAAQAGVRYSIENPKVYTESNLLGFANILECCRNYKVDHLLFASSSSVYGNDCKVPFSTKAKLDNPVSYYAATKKANELMAASYVNLYKLKCTAMRFFTVYGPMGRPDMAMMIFANAMKEHKSIKVFNNGDLSRDFTYIDDVVECVIKLMNNAPAGYEVFNVGRGAPTKLLDFINELEQCFGYEAKKEFLDMQAGDVYRTYADTSHLEKIIKFKPQTSLNDGVRKFFQWFMSYYQ
ncbi:GDP-mannose 4,6-dehydratase [Lentisphaera marina]|uniref:NAD-dependent epimerase/dehydratase family protein n=1 Tax=Lentisphaera marina TaxID=1111041 RepID=UPI002365152E|nr:NAD-dependent epimerase/dehydratase family protein [Lentisphaera marina]MDD7985738.1 GDP-mannose 4,6-dehydratase [Lentisphaera marina]